MSYWAFIGTEVAILCRNSQMKTEEKKNPLYYKFLFTRGNIEMKEYRPFQIFEKTVQDFFKNTVKREMPAEILRAKLYALWSMVHGLAQLVTIQGVINLNDIDGEIEKILSSVTV